MPLSKRATAEIWPPDRQTSAQGKAILPGARLYLLDDHDKITSEQVVFFAVPE
jgi:hypothetical protein